MVALTAPFKLLTSSLNPNRIRLSCRLPLRRPRRFGLFGHQTDGSCRREARRGRLAASPRVCQHRLRLRSLPRRAVREGIAL